MQTVITQYKDLTRWDVKFFFNTIQQKNGWEILKLSDFLKPYRKRVELDENTEYKQITIKINHKGVIERGKQKGGDIKTKPQFEVNSGQFIISKIDAKDGAFGIIPENLDKAIITGSFISFDFEDKLINKDFFDLYISQDWFLNILRSISVGTTGRKPIMVEDFLNLEIQIPPLPIQKKIVEEWHKAKKQEEELNKKAEEQEKGIDIEMSKELGISIQNNKNRKGIFCIKFSILERWDVSYNAKELLTSGKAKYDWVKLKKYCENAQYGFTGSAVGADTSTKFLRITDLDYSGNYSEDSLPFVKISKNSKQKYLLSKDDFVFARTGATAGKCAIIKKHKQDVVFASYLIRFKFTDDIYLPFLEQYLNQGPGKRIISEIVYSSGQPNINANEIQEIKIPLPPLPKQKQIAERVEKMRAEIQEMKNTADEILEQAKNKIGEMLKS